MPAKKVGVGATPQRLHRSVYDAPRTGISHNHVGVGATPQRLHRSVYDAPVTRRPRKQEIFANKWNDTDEFMSCPAKEVGEAGEKTPIFPAGKVAIWIAKQSVARQIYGCFEMVSPPRKRLYYR